MSGPEREDLDAAVALLARALSGDLEALQTGGITWIPRPQPQKPSSQPSAPPSVPSPPSPPLSSEASMPVAGPVAPRVALPIVDDTAATDESIRALLEGPGGAEERLERLLVDVVGDCRRCKLHRGRSKVVFGVGNPEADLVFVGEGPGGEEDRQGIPFVGKAGQLLTKMIEAMNLRRDDVYICNVVKCRPPNNRDPERDEVLACERFLKAQLAIVRPKVIVALGRYATQTLLKSDVSISRLRGQWAEYERIPLLPTFHPAYLLREPASKRQAWSDLQQVMKRLGVPPAG